MEQTPQGGVIPTAGKSAYQLWLDAGNIGTVIDFLRSLKTPDISLNDLTPEQIALIKGVKGDKGDRGEKGDSIVGAKGEKGDQGEKGNTGERGMPGLGGGGTTNILDNSDFATADGWSFVYNDPSGTIAINSNEAVVKIPYGDFFGTPPMLLYSGQTYTFSFEAQSAAALSLGRTFLFGPEQRILAAVNVATAWNRLVLVVLSVKTTGTYRIGLGHETADVNLTVRNFKMERGIVSAPEWSPSINSMRGVKGDKGEKGDRGDKGDNGSTGESGSTWLPSVSSSGVISWINSTLQTIPTPINIKGAKGDAGSSGATGATGAKGDKGEMVGVNLLINSCFRSAQRWAFSPYGTSGSFSVANNVANVTLPNNSRFGFEEIMLDMPGDYTYSFDVRTDNGYQLNNIHFVGQTATKLPNIERIYSYWRRILVHFTVQSAGMYYVTVGQIDGLTINAQFRKMKLERGTKQTPEWTPSIIELANGTDGFDIL